MFISLKSMCMLMLVISMAILIQAQITHTPVYAWATTIKGKKAEIKDETTMKAVSEDIKNILDKTEANSLIVYIRPSMTTQGLYNVLMNNHKIGNLLRKASPRAVERSYTNVVGSSIQDEFKSLYQNAKHVTISSQAELDGLKSEIENAPKPFINQIYLIELPFEKDEIFDDVVLQIENVFATRSLNNHVSVLAGSSTVARFLQEVDFELSGARNSAYNDDDEVLYLDSTILFKNLLVVPLVLLLIVAMLQMYYIKTPTLFVDKGIDFGKIEK